MSFKTILKRLVDSTGATGAVLLASDGEVVESYSSSQAELDLIGAHQGIVLSSIKDAAQRSASSAVRSVTISTEKTRLVILTVKEGYYIVVTAPRARFAGMVLMEGGGALKSVEDEMR